MLKNLHFQFQTFQKLEYFWQTWKTLAPGLPVVHDKARAFHSFQDLSEDPLNRVFPLSSGRINCSPKLEQFKSDINSAFEHGFEAFSFLLSWISAYSASVEFWNSKTKFWLFFQPLIGQHDTSIIWSRFSAGDSLFTNTKFNAPVDSFEGEKYFDRFSVETGEAVGVFVGFRFSEPF